VDPQEPADAARRNGLEAPGIPGVRVDRLRPSVGSGEIETRAQGEGAQHPLRNHGFLLSKMLRIDDSSLNEASFATMSGDCATNKYKGILRRKGSISKHRPQNNPHFSSSPSNQPILRRFPIIDKISPSC